MNLQVNQTGINSLNLNAEKKVDTAKQEKQETKQQIKEHCSSKAGKALRGMALGLMLATSVASAGKAVPVNAAGVQSSNNETAVTQEAEANVAKTDVEMAVDKAMNTEAKSSVLRVDVNSKVPCEGEMTGEDRNYEKAQISEDGVLTFYDESSETGFHREMKYVGDGKYERVTRLKTEYSYDEMTSFNLGSSVENKGLELQVGQKYGETTEKNGDYVMLAEDGKTLNVYDNDGKCIGSCSYETVDEYNDRVDVSTKGVVAGLGLAGAVVGLSAAGITIADKVLSKHKEE